MIVTIDGPAAAGKSTAARKLAERLGFEYLDTGAMYRAMALAMMRRDIEPTEPNLQRLAELVRIDVAGVRVLLDGEDVTQEIRSPDVTRASRHTADSPAVRGRMVERQRQIAASRNVVTEGRDQGTVVFPDATLKVFLTAAPEERARRRYRELLARGIETTIERVLAEQQERDRCDAERPIGAMMPANGSVRLDSTALTLDAVVDQLEAHARAAMSQTSSQHVCTL